MALRLIHAVEDEHKGTGMSSVIFIGVVPRFEHNLQYLERQKLPLLEGQSAPDFRLKTTKLDTRIELN